MDIFDFFNSSDIADYCKEIGHSFNTIEMAAIIERSDKTIYEKLKAYRELIDDYPNMYFHKSVTFRINSSVHDYLKALIDYMNAQITTFQEPIPEKRAFNIATCSVRDLQQIYGLKNKISDCKKYFSIEELIKDLYSFWEEKKMPIIRVCKNIGRGKRLYADVDYRGEVVYIENYIMYHDDMNPRIEEIVDNGYKHSGLLSDLYIYIYSFTVSYMGCGYV